MFIICSGFEDRELIARYEDFARRSSAARAAGNVRLLNSLSIRMAAVSDAIKRRGPACRVKLVPFLDDPDPSVRYDAARDLYALFPERARAVIEEIHATAVSSLAAGTAAAVDHVAIAADRVGKPPAGMSWAAAVAEASMTAARIVRRLDRTCMDHARASFRPTRADGGG